MIITLRDITMEKGGKKKNNNQNHNQTTAHPASNKKILLNSLVRKDFVQLDFAWIQSHSLAETQLL